MPYTYTAFGYPAQRPGLVQACSWQGPDDNLRLEVSVNDYFGNLKTVTFTTRNTGAGRSGMIVLPSSADVDDVEDETWTAHLRMATLISDAIIGSTEWTSALLEGPASNIQSAIGLAKIVAVRVLNQQDIELDVRKGSGPIHTIAATRDQFPSRAMYASNPSVYLDPETQCLVIAGAVEKQYPTYVHDYPGTILSSAHRDEIVSYVSGLSLWV